MLLTPCADRCYLCELTSDQADTAKSLVEQLLGSPSTPSVASGNNSPSVPAPCTVPEAKGKLLPRKSPYARVVLSLDIKDPKVFRRCCDEAISNACVSAFRYDLKLNAVDRSHLDTNVWNLVLHRAVECDSCHVILHLST